MLIPEPKQIKPKERKKLPRACEFCGEVFHRREDTLKAADRKGIPACCNRACLNAYRERELAGDTDRGTLTAEVARRIFKYEPETGKLIWKEAFGNRAKIGEEAGYLNFYGYRVVMFRKKNWPVHRVIWLMVHGRLPDGEIDHINHNRADNRISNLRDTTRSGNMRNMSRSVCNKSGCPGVFWSASLSKWCAQIHEDNKARHIGVFSAKEDAVKARKAEERRLGYHKNHGAVPA